MKRRATVVLAFSSISVLCLLPTGCNGGKSDPQAEAPPPLKVERVEDRNVFQVEHPEKFALAQAADHTFSVPIQATFLEARFWINSWWPRTRLSRDSFADCPRARQLNVNDSWHRGLSTGNWNHRWRWLVLRRDRFKHLVESDFVVQ